MSSGDFSKEAVDVIVTGIVGAVLLFGMGGLFIGLAPFWWAKTLGAILVAVGGGLVGVSIVVYQIEKRGWGPR